MENNYICCFTGHRFIPDGHVIYIPSLIEEAIRNQYHKGARVFRTGGALGFDSFAALKVIHMRQSFPDIRLELCLPCRDQAAKWSGRDQYIYGQILDVADSVRYVGDVYTSGCMYARNRMLVDGARVCIAYYDGGNGGTGYTYSYAQRNGVKIINLYDMIKNQ